RSFVSLPGRAVSVDAVGSRAYVGIEGSDAETAVVDVSNPDSPKLLSLLSHRPKRRALLPASPPSVAFPGDLALAVAQLIDQHNQPAKGLLSVTPIRSDGTAHTVLRANLAEARAVQHLAGGALVLYDSTRLAAFDLPALLVTGVTPGDREEQ